LVQRVRGKSVCVAGRQIDGTSPQSAPEPRQKRFIQHTGAKRIELVGIENGSPKVGVVPGGKLVIQPCIVLITIAGLPADGEQIVAGAWKIRERHFGQQVHSRSIQRERIQGRGAKTAGPLGCGGNAEKVREGVADSQPVIIEEEKRSLLYDRTSERSTELIL